MAKKPIRAVEVLLIEDNPADVRGLKEFLKKRALPTKLHVVDRGEAALAFLRHEGWYAKAPPPQVIFLDLQLPSAFSGYLLGNNRAYVVEKPLWHPYLFTGDSPRPIVHKH